MYIRFILYLIKSATISTIKNAHFKSKSNHSIAPKNQTKFKSAIEPTHKKTLHYTIAANNRSQLKRKLCSEINAIIKTKSNIKHIKSKSLHIIQPHPMADLTTDRPGAHILHWLFRRFSYHTSAASLIAGYEPAYCCYQTSHANLVTRNTCFPPDLKSIFVANVIW